ncbi:hypothetical protein MUK42_10911 [Musa troglodytarum]|uniref:Uncharacterized protein n=1 Tax=Musa troglodytarum TaxID=320322 RepID=A0A9E7GKE4_9LILI|nr:hypothetical protein MUK42_10911 [Musa troglodytarum]
MRRRRRRGRGGGRSGTVRSRICTPCRSLSASAQKPGGRRGPGQDELLASSSCVVDRNST